MTDSVIGLDASDPSKKITINKKDRFEQLYIIGSTRQGKSTLIENLVLEDIKNDLGVCLIDPHGDLVNNIISRMAFRVGLLKNPKLEDKDRKKLEHIKRRLESDIVYIDLADKTYVAPFNLFHCEKITDDEAVENVVSAFLHILQSSFGISPDQHARMNQYFRHIATLLVYNQNHTMLDILQLLTDDRFMLQLVENVPDHWEKVFWKEFYAKYSRGTRRMEDISMISNKIEEFISPVMRPWFGDTKKTIHFRKLMDQGKIVLIKSNPQWETITKIVGNVVIAQLLDAAYSRRDIPLDKRKQMNVYVDEYAKFASEDFSKLFSEAAKYGLSMSITQQVLEQVDPTIKAVCAQAKNVAVFSVSPQNGKELASVFDCSPQPGPTISKPLKTPVMEPIQYMTTHGVYPKDVTRQFIENYGKLLVENARKEEELERDRKREEQRYEHDVIAGVRYLAAPIIKVTTENRLLLKKLNDLFYEAMMCGKRKENPDTIFIDTDFILETLKGIKHHNLPSNIVDADKRVEKEKLLQEKLAGLSDYQDQEIVLLKSEKYEEEVKLKEIYQRYIFMEPLCVAKHLAIVEMDSRYYIADIIDNFPYRIGTSMLRRFGVFSVPEDPPYNGTYIRLGDIYHPTYFSNTSATWFRSWEDAVGYYCKILHNLWFSLENTLPSKGWWHKEIETVDVDICVSAYWDGYNKMGGGASKNTKIVVEHRRDTRKLNVWTPILGIEKTWYTNSMFERELERRIGNFKKEKPDWRMGILCGWMRIVDKDELIVNQLIHIFRSIVALDIKLEKAIQALPEKIEQERQAINQELSIIAGAQSQIDRYTTALKNLEQELRTMMRELAEAPVEADSGLTQELPGPEILTPEVEARIANQLKQLPKYTARVKLVSGEYTITTIKPEEQIGNTALQKRIVEIQERNRKAGYLRLREEVKEEIRKRYEPQQPPASPIPPQTPKQPKQPTPPAKRKAAIGKICPKCGANNAADSLYCSQDGTKL